MGQFCVFILLMKDLMKQCFLATLEVKNMSFDHNKIAPKKRKKQLLAKEMGEERRSTLSIRYLTLQ